MSTPSTVMRPALTGDSRRIMRPIVVLPLPLSPISEITSPGLAVKLTSRTAGTFVPPKAPAVNVLLTESSSSISRRSVAARGGAAIAREASLASAKARL